MGPQGSTPEIENQDGIDHSPEQDYSADNADQDFDQPSDSQDDDANYGDDDQDNDGAPSDSSDDDDGSADEESANEELKRWAASQGYTLDSASAIAMAKRIRNQQQSFHESRQNAQESKQKFTDAVAETDKKEDDKYAALERKFARSEFFESHPEARELEGEMYDYAVKTLNGGDVEGFKYFQTPHGWNALLQIVKAEKASSQGDDSYDKGRADERKNLAKKHQASGPSKNAIDSNPKDTKITDEVIGKMSMDEYEQYKKDHPDFNPFAV